MSSELWTGCISLLGGLAEHFLAGGVKEYTEEIHGREREIVVPLRIDREHHQALSRRGANSVLLPLLKSLPLIDEILNDDPMAKIDRCTCHLGGKPSVKPADDDLV